MRVAEGVDEVADPEAAHLRDHVGQQGVARDVEGHAEEGIRRALVELAGEPPLAHVELEQAVAGGERHPVEVGGIPGRDDQAAGIGIAPDLTQHPGDLVDRAAAGLLPGAPLLAVDRTEIALRVRPLVPGRHAARPGGGASS